jgi:hypothetical protein
MPVAVLGGGKTAEKQAEQQGEGPEWPIHARVVRPHDDTSDLNVPFDDRIFGESRLDVEYQSNTVDVTFSYIKGPGCDACHR